MERLGTCPSCPSHLGWRLPGAIHSVAAFLGRVLEDRKSGSVVLTPMSSAVHQLWKAAAKISLPPRGFPGTSLPELGKVQCFQ